MYFLYNKDKTNFKSIIQTTTFNDNKIINISYNHYCFLIPVIGRSAGSEAPYDLDKLNREEFVSN